jgi:hypothetical protein
MAKKERGKFEVDVSALDMSSKELAALDRSIQKAVLSHLAGMETKIDIARAWGRPGHTDGIYVVPQDLQRF